MTRPYNYRHHHLYYGHPAPTWVQLCRRCNRTFPLSPWPADHDCPEPDPAIRSINQLPGKPR